MAFRVPIFFVLALASAGCAGGPEARSSATTAAATTGGDSLATAEENAALEGRVEMLESRLAAVEAENDELRALLSRATARADSVRIGGDATRTASSEPELTVESSEPDEEGTIEERGPRPLLTLHGPPVVAGAAPASERPALAAASPLAGPVAPAVALPPPSGSLGRLLVTGAPTDVPAIPLAPVTVLSGAPTETDAVALEYQSALRRLADRDLDGALSALARFTAAHPSHPYADNALYFRGEILYARHEFRPAIDELTRMIEHYPTGGRVADALLRIGMCWERLGDSARALHFFTRVRNEHPDSSAARMAEREDT